MKKSLLIAFILAISYNFSIAQKAIFKNNSCDSIPKTFKNYKEATRTIESANFIYNDTADTSKSSWIWTARYYSCPGIVSFMIIETKSQDYIYQNVPLTLWQDFKKASSFGRFYNEHFKGRYGLKVK